MYSAVVNNGVEDFHIFTMLVILLHFVWWEVAADPHFGLAWPLCVVVGHKVEYDVSPEVPFHQDVFLASLHNGLEFINHILEEVFMPGRGDM